ncbi:hypothetical protein [Streptomyces sp. NBRC 110611]|uniref:hypothetical protein n=1 Tax=Streptomyces sp. NBRC 110611 TaxID=1621259 RepID=UPI000A678AE5|nr:hypothetical protein [Streptomyces sp. NBRC 110611]
MPTPTATFIQDTIAPEVWQARRERAKARNPGMGDMGLPLGLAVRLLPTPRNSDTNGAGTHGHGGPDLRTAVSLLPTPTASDDRGHDAPGRKGGPSLTTVAGLLPTPRASDGEKGGPNQRGSKGDLTLSSATARLLPTPTASEHGSHYATAEERKAAGHQAYLSNVMTSLTSPPAAMEPQSCGIDWGPYAAAVKRWEEFTRSAPQPVDDRGRLNPALVEWLMGLPDGHVTAVPDLSRAAQLKALGNSVVPQQAAAALRLLLDRSATTAAS